MSRDLPPGFVEFTNELAQSQSKERRSEESGCLTGCLTGLCTLLFVLLLAFPTGAALRQVAFDLGPTRTTGAEVVRVDSGRPVVRFTAEDGALVYAWLPHDPRADDARVLEVTYRVNHPQDALAVGHPRSCAGPVLIVLLAAWVLFEVFHRRGLRAGWFWRRTRTMVKGPLTREEQTRLQRRNARRSSSVQFTWRTKRPIPGPRASAMVGLVLTLGGLAMLGAALVSHPEVWAMFAVIALCFGVGSLRGAVYRYADTVPVTDPPRPFRLLPRGAFRWVSPVLVVVAIVVTIPTLPVGYDAVPPVSGGEVHGRARIVDDGCHQARSGSACEAYVVLEYRANGMDYQERVVVDLLGLDDLVARETVAIVWDRDDPRQVRLVSP